MPRYDQILTGHERRHRDRCWRPQGSDDWLLVQTLSGRAEVALPYRRLALEPGDAILYQPGATHDFGSEGCAGGWELLWAHFIPPAPWQELLAWPEVGAGVLHMPAPEAPLRERVEACLLAADNFAVSGVPQAARLALNSLEAALLWWDIQNPLRRRLDPRVLEAIEYLSRNLSRRVSLAELARAVHLSTSRLAHLFRKETGVTPARYGELQRFERAKQLLELTSLPVHQVARQTGFESAFYFATRFRRLTGQTPSSFRALRQVPDGLTNSNPA